MKKWLIIGVVVLALVGVVWFRFFRSTDAPSAVSVERGTVVETVDFTGSLTPDTYADLSFAGVGRVASVEVALGETVTKGQVLARLETPVEQAQYNASTIAVAISETEEKNIRRNWDDLNRDEKNLARLKSEQARAQRSVTQAQFVSSVVKAPFSGVVTRMDLRVGEVASVNTSLVRVTAKGGMKVKSDIAESDIVKLTVGDRVKVDFDALPEEVFDGSIESLGLSANVTQDVVSYEALFRVDTLDERLRDGMTANVTLTTEKRENVLVLPARALKRAGGKVTVTVLGTDNKTEEVREVTLGLEGDDGRVEILSGVAEGERVTIGATQAK